MKAVVGQGNSIRDVFACIAVALIITSYPLLLAQILQPDVYYFQDRTTYHDFFPKSENVENFLALGIVLCLIAWIFVALRGNVGIVGGTAGIIVSSISYLAFRYDWIVVISLVSLPLMLAIFATNYKAKQLISPPKRHLPLIANFVCLSLLVFGSISILVSLLGLDAMQYDPLYQIFVLFSTISPLLVFLIIMLVPILAILNYTALSSKIRKRLQLYIAVRNPAPEIQTKTKVILLTGFVAISISLIIIPQFLPGGQEYVGVDTPAYLDWIDIINESSYPAEYIWRLFVDISDGDRALSLWMIHLLIQLSSTEDYSKVIEIGIPILVSPLLVVSTYFLSRETTQDDRISLIAAFLSAIGFQVLVGLYAGFFANWIALIPAYLSILFLLRFLKCSKFMDLAIFAIGLSILLFVHVYTWTIITIFILLFLTLSAIKHKFQKKLIFFSFLVVASSVGADFLRSYAFGLELGVERDLSIAESADAGFSQFAVRWDNLVRTIQVHTGGFYGNFIFLTLVLSGLLIARSNASVWLFVGSFVSVGILPLFFGNVIIMSRVIYDIPFQIPAAISLAALSRTSYGLFRVTTILFTMMTVSILLVSNIR